MRLSEGAALAAHLPDITVVIGVEAVVERDLLSRLDGPPRVDPVGCLDRGRLASVIEVADGLRQNLPNADVKLAKVFPFPRRKCGKLRARDAATSEACDHVAGCELARGENASAFATRFADTNALELHLVDGSAPRGALVGEDPAGEFRFRPER